MADNIQDLWQAYRSAKEPAIKEKLILEYAPLVKLVAGRISIHIGQYVDFDDLISYGIFGLIDAIDKFNMDKGVKFETYASLRIRGEIIDNIRRLDWIPNKDVTVADVVQTKADTPDLSYEKKEVKEILINAINKLTEKEKKVVTLYYFEELTLKEISKVMNVSESRISQIHSKAIVKLQNKLGKYKSILFLN